MIRKQDHAKQLKSRLEKIVINSGIGRLSTTPNFEEKVLPEVVKELAAITGQHPAPRSAKQSISGFRLRQGTIVGLKVTLRGRRMMDFLHKLDSVVLPRLRDFRGINLKNVDANGNLSIGLREHVVFPEIIPEHTKVNFGIQVIVVPKKKSRVAAIELYREMGVPLQKQWTRTAK